MYIYIYIYDILFQNTHTNKVIPGCTYHSDVTDHQKNKGKYCILQKNKQRFTYIHMSYISRSNNADDIIGNHGYGSQQQTIYSTLVITSDAVNDATI